MIYDNSHCDIYEEFCEEIMAYMRCQDEPFNFGEGLMEMTDGGEYGMYKIAILHYLNEPYYEKDKFIKKWKAERVDVLHRNIEAKYDDLSNENLKRKQYNRYNTNIKWRKKRAYIAKYKRHSHGNYPYITKFDEDGNEYVTRCNINNKKYKAWDKKKRKKPTTRSYIYYCEYCEKVIIYHDETMCDFCYSYSQAEDVFNFEYWEENWIWANNDFSEHEVNDGHWWFHDFYDGEEARWNILHMKLN